ncbi:Nuclear pore complex protein [Mycena indigotica]|uniref:Nuclear pore complex protein n=1 Tax=Mycena indigotica TaxID=2126181 RepID=A0A8H6VWN0_9AGAR|nr:Nuclear pore complex protein [Mycena indigotica]KAF7294646.1 Nuclear pore complex protein [Mycena indigotica]
MAETALYVSSAEVLSICQSMNDDLEAILHPETGFAPRLRQICHDQLLDLEENRDARTTQDELELLRLERDTWGLLQAVMPARKTETPPMPTIRDLLAENPYTPTSTLAQAVLLASPLLSELVAVREWLQDSAPLPQHPEATTGYWKFTKHNIMQSQRMGGATRDNLVKEMDPDAVNRDDGRMLAADDASHEKGLSQALYGYIRSGRLEEAVELCRNAHQPWRAASIRGSLLFQWKAISNEHDEDEAMEEDFPDVWQGNQRRQLWKSTCTKAATNPHVPEHDRILYAALVPTPQTSNVLKAACRTWEDHLWAQVSVVCEEKQSMEMNRVGGSFWEGGLAAVESGVRVISAETEEIETEEWEREVRGSLEALKSVGVMDGPGAQHPFHYSQLQIILNRIDPLMDNFATGIQDGTYSPDSFEYTTMCRFLAHLCLFLQMIDIPVPPLATQVILESYLQVLEAAGQRDLIAMYAGALGDNAVERYALFLVSLELSVDIDERKLALTRAREHGLDMDRVAVVTAERTIDQALQVLPPLKGRLPSIIALPPPATDEEMFLLRSIEWTIFDDKTYETALEQANVILRYFLGSGRVQLAQKLLVLLPIELASIPEPEERATEYLHYRQFFVIWETLERVVDCQALETPQMNRSTKAAWLQDYQGLIDQAHDQITKLLTSDWLVDVDESLDRRRRDLIRIRQIFIPELIIRLHFVLFSSRGHFPGNLKRTLDLANIVADSRYRLYEDFVNEDGRRLGDYLGAVRQTILGGLEGGGSDPFRILSL